MKKLKLAVAVALGLSIPFVAVSISHAQTATHEITRGVSAEGLDRRDGCWISAGTKVKYVNREPTITRANRTFWQDVVVVIEPAPGTNCQPGFLAFIAENAITELSATPTVQEVFTTGNWGDDVPVFGDRRSYFNARDNKDFENVVCRLKQGDKVEFQPFRNWGVGEVETDNCKGWIDRGVIR